MSKEKPPTERPAEKPAADDVAPLKRDVDRTDFVESVDIRFIIKDTLPPPPPDEEKGKK